MSKIYGICPQCGKEITKVQRKFCSKNCAIQNLKKEHRLCLNCNQITKRTTTKFCSFICRNEWLKQNNLHYGGIPKKLIQQVCKYCSTEFINTKHNKFCSELCKEFYNVKDKIIFNKLQICLYCNKQIYKKYKIKYCSHKCEGLARRDNGELDYFIEAGNQQRKKPISEETRQKMSIAASKRNANTQFTKGKGGYREDIGHYVRSRWEANYARYLKYNNIAYEYEKYRFTLKNNDRYITYTPDFKCGDIFYEVKGWWNEKSLLIKRLMKEQYPDIKIKYINEKEYFSIKKLFFIKIPAWE